MYNFEHFVSFSHIIHSTHSSIAIRLEVFVHLFVASKISGENLPVVPTRELNLVLPYFSQPSHYLYYTEQCHTLLSYAAPLVRIIFTLIKCLCNLIFHAPASPPPPSPILYCRSIYSSFLRTSPTPSILNILHLRICIPTLRRSLLTSAPEKFLTN